VVKEPTAEQIRLPKGYGKTTRTLSWTIVRTELEQAKQYWLATVRGSGPPHIVPLDGLWIDDAWYYGGAKEATHVQLAEANPNATLHLPDPFRCVVVEGEVRRHRPDDALAERLAEGTNTKYAEYGYQNTAADYTEVSALTPRRVIAWMQFPGDVTRFVF
jgi:nitroimidazol reductase NimA-like FMN-containing flavoprotein (pyridoxamine 5'-phosphate oxidase superfamily)